MAVKMIAIILGGVFLGRWADGQTEFETPIFTLICSLVFVGLAIYVFIRDSSK